MRYDACPPHATRLISQPVVRGPGWLSENIQEVWTMLSGGFISQVGMSKMPILLINGKFWVETSLNGVYVVYDKAGMFTFNLKHTNNLKMSKNFKKIFLKPKNLTF